MRLAMSVLIFNLVLGFWLAYNTLLYWWNDEYCREFCFPYEYDMYDEETCACWMPDGSIQIKEVEYE